MAAEESRSFTELAELLEQDELAIFIGPDAPASLTGAPSWAELAQRLAERGGYGSAPGWPQVAARYEQENGRHNLIRWLRGQFSSAEPGPLYRGLARLPVSHYISATFDTLLEQALEEAERGPNVVAEDPDLNFIVRSRPTLVKLLGQATSGRFDSLQLTAGDLQTLARSRAEILDNIVYPLQTRKNLLIIGQDLSEDFFRDIYFQGAPGANSLRRRAYGVWQNVEPWQRDSWAGDHLTIIDSSPLVVAYRLLGEEPPQTEPVDEAEADARQAAAPQSETAVKEPVRQVPPQTPGTRRLSGAEYGELAEALLDAFPDYTLLRRMVRIQFDLNLAEFAGAKLTDSVDNLIDKAESENWTDKLVLGATESNPTNGALQSFASKRGLTSTDGNDQ